MHVSCRFLLRTDVVTKYSRFNLIPRTPQASLSFQMQRYVMIKHFVIDLCSLGRVKAELS